VEIEKYYLNMLVVKKSRAAETTEKDSESKRNSFPESKNKALIRHFVGNGRKAKAAIDLPSYYGELLAWGLARHMEREDWAIEQALGYHEQQPIYKKICTGCEKGCQIYENLLVDGEMLVKKGDSRLVITAKTDIPHENMVQVMGLASQKKECNQFAEDIRQICQTENFYRSKKLEFAGHIRFMDINAEPCDSFKLNDNAKAELKSKTTGLFNTNKKWTKFGAPLKRCVLIRGDSDTVNRAICCELMAGAEGITCIVTNAANLDYRSADELYQLARDLSPTLVFMENADRISESTKDDKIQKDSPLKPLFSLLGSISEYEEIITVATTSCPDALANLPDNNYYYCD